MTICISFLLAIFLSLFNTNKLEFAPVNNPIIELSAGEVPLEEGYGVSITISAIGDCVLGTDERFPFEGSFNNVFLQQGGDYRYFFSNVRHIFESDDLTIANLEGQITDYSAKEDKRHQDRPFFFRGPPHYRDILKYSGIDVVNLANNHSHDYGEQGFKDTVDNLQKSGIAFFGYGNVHRANEKGIRIGLLSYNDLGPLEEGVDIDTLKEQIKNDISALSQDTELIVVGFHWGIEYQQYPTKRQVELGHYAIDCGADLILGHHPHSIQGLERYKERFIVYSLGNFCYGGNKNPPDKDTFIFQQEFLFDEKRNIGEIGFPVIIPSSISSKEEYNDYRPTPLSGEDSLRILDRLNSLSSCSDSGIPIKTYEDMLIEENRPSNDNIPMETARLLTGDGIADAVDEDFVNLLEFIPGIMTELKYATEDNFFGSVIYNNDVPFLRKGTAEKLKKGQELADQFGLRLKIWDAYRPVEAQWELWEAFPDPMYIASPLRRFSVHNRGAAVDVTLVDIYGNELEMPSGFDDFTERANRDYKFADKQATDNAKLLEYIMIESGFSSIFSEWWHFVDSESDNYSVVNKVLILDFGQ